MLAKCHSLPQVFVHGFAIPSIVESSLVTSRSNHAVESCPTKSGSTHNTETSCNKLGQFNRSSRKLIETYKRLNLCRNRFVKLACTLKARIASTGKTCKLSFVSMMSFCARFFQLPWWILAQWREKRKKRDCRLT